MITDIALKLRFPQEAVDYLCECLDVLTATDGVMDKLTLAEENFFTGEEHEYKDLLQNIADKTQINRFTVDMLFLLISSERLHNMFLESGFSDALFYELMLDLRYKLIECKNLYGVWGTFVLDWFRNGYRLNRFKLGRLQYQYGVCPVDDYKGIVKRGDPILYIHIPSAGPMRIEDVCDSLRLAYRFYKDMLVDGKLILFCESWLLYQPLFCNYSEKSNIKKFYNLFDIVKNIHDNKNSDFWRVFNVEYSEQALDNVKADNSLKAMVLNHLKNGGTLGEGIGVLIIDDKF